MKESTKKAWVKALRSGKYKQCRGQLVRRGKDETSYCCLGVLNRIKHTAQSYDFLGLTQKEQDTLVKLNDEEKRTFKQIANFIEKNIKGV